MKSISAKTPPSQPAGSSSSMLLLAATLITGIANSLEAQTQALDFGDAPRFYPVIMNNGGAFHGILKGFNLGALIDAEQDGQPSGLADADDLNPLRAQSDEDGVQFNTNPLVAGQLANVTLALSAGQGRIDAWVDFNRDGDWEDAGEQIFTGEAIGAGSTLLRFTVPQTAVAGQSFARFRLSREGGLKPGGFAPDGEVEDYAISIGNPEVARDFSDAPAPYPTSLKENGARHRILKGFQLGERIDAEADGQPDSDAVGDDKNPANSVSDEDGVTLQTNPLLVGKDAFIEFLVGGLQGRIDAWIDFNQDGDWLDEGEQIFHSEAVAPGSNSKSFIVPAGAKEGLSYARFRLSQQGSLAPTGESFDGEVEDYIVRIQQPEQFFDFGDAPALYPTLLGANGARHSLMQGFFLGKTVDLEVNGNPNADATGDDLAGSANIGSDEDGVRFPASSLRGGTTAQVEVTLSSGRGALDAWIDFNRDGDWADAGEQIAAAQILNPGSNMITFNVPGTTVAGLSFSRFRLSLQGGLPPFGPSPVGEVEDHQVNLEKAIETFDFGDAPENYPVLLSQNGARHGFRQGFFLGAVLDQEQNGQPSSDATGDDQAIATTGARDDEDGVRFLSAALTGGTTAQVEVSLTGGQGILDAWIDFNRDGDWADAGEQIATGLPMFSGASVINFPVPAGTVAGLSFARFRVSSQGVPSFTGFAADGEVEDHQVRLEKAVDTFDFGDAPAPYPTLLANNGARHPFREGFFLGAAYDQEANGQPNATATGDDQVVAGTPQRDDEDGVKFLSSALTGGTTAQVEVTVTGIRGMLDAWIDFNRDGDWADAGEQIATAQLMNNGANVISFTVPNSTVEGVSFARFRLSSQGGLGVTGLASDGEVEDHQVTLAKMVETFDFGDAPAPYPTLLASNGARHPFREGFFLGAVHDQELNGQPNATATGDDQVTAGTAQRDDEDGVKFLAVPLTGGTTAQVEVTVTGVRGMLDAWVDFNRDGDWADAGEQIATAQLMNNGVNVLSFTVPSSTVEGISFSRFRLSSQGGLGVTGIGADGEVEDHQVTLAKMVETFDFGDAPAPYPTTLKDNGARHALKQRFVMGQLIDLEPDGQPSSGASGDDANNPGPAASDEDGVKFLTTPLVPTQTARMEVTLLSGPGRLDAWMDWNRDGDWADAGEQILTSAAAVAGANTFDIKVPENAVAGESYARIRLSSQGGLSYTGFAIDGEVEDYLVRIGSRPSIDLSITKRDSPDPIMVGDTLTYFISVSNTGQTPATGVKITDPVHASATIVDATASLGACSISGGVVTCNFGTLAPQSSAGVIIRVTPNVAGVLNNTVTVEANEPDATPQNNSTTITTTVISRPQVPCDERTNRGTNFWVTFPGNYAPDPDNPIRLSIGIVGPRLTTGTVAIPGLGFSANFTIPASQEVVITLPNTADLGNVIDVVENKGINIRASAEVAVFGLNRVLYTTDGFLALPTDVAGQAYLVQGYKNVHEGVPELSGTQFAVVAQEDNTRVAIRPSVAAAGRAAGVPYQIVLNRGQTYQLRSTNDAPADLSGSIVIADKPISVFAGHQCANVASKDMFFCDYLVEQLLSYERAGTRFMSMPLATRTGGDTFRFAAFQNGTTILVNGSPIATINAGQIIERLISGPSLILSDKPIQVTQFANSSDFDGRINADPFMIVLQHQGQYLNRVPVWTPNAGYAANYINVIAPTAAIGTVTLDGVAIPAAAFSGIPGSGYSGAQLSVAPGAHTVQANVPVGVICYGWAEFDSYGYPGGMFFGDTQPPQFTGPAGPIVVNLGTSSTAQCTSTIPDLRQQVQVTDNCQMPTRIVIDQEPKPGTVVGPGTYQIVLTSADAKGNIGSYVVEYRVIDETPVVLTCPQDMVVNCQTEEGAKVSFRVLARSRCDTIQVETDPPSGSFFPIGTTTVTASYTDSTGKTQTCSFKVTVQCMPTLVITRGTNNQVQLNWGGNQVLQSAQDVTGPWSTVTGAQPPFNVTPTGSRRYYRIVPTPQ